MSKVLHRAFELRQKGDYMEEVEVTSDDVDEIRPAAELFVECAEKYLLERQCSRRLSGLSEWNN